MRESYGRMRPHRWTLPLLLALVLAAAAPSAVNASPTLTTGASARHVYIAPGGYFTVEGASEPGLNVTVCLRGTNNETYLFIFNVLGDGYFKYNVTLPPSMASDVYRVTVETGSVLLESLTVTVSSVDRGQVVAQLLLSARNTFEGLNAYMAELESRGYTVPPQVAEDVDKAEQALEEAQTMLEAGMPEEAWAKVKEAQELLLGALKTINQPELPPVTEAQTAAMNQTLTRARDYFNRLRRSADSLRERGWDTSPIEDVLDDAESLLGDAERQYREGDRRGFEATMRQVTERLRDAQTALNSELSKVKITLALRYRESIQSRVTKMRESLSTYQSVIPLAERTRVMYELTLTEEKLARIQQNLAAGELDLDELVDVSDDIGAALQNVSNEDIRIALEEMNRLRNRVDTLVQEGSQGGEWDAETLRSKIEAESLKLQRIKEYLSSLSTHTNRP